MYQDHSEKDTAGTQSNDENIPGSLSDGANTASIESLGKPVSTLTSPINLQEIALSQDYATTVGIKKVLTNVPVRKPDKQTFFRVHPDLDYQLDTMVLEMKEERETYLVMPNLRDEMAGEITPKTIFTCITRQGDCFLWPIKLPGEDGRLDPWNQSAFDAAEIGKERWIRLVANLTLGAYQVYEATGALPDPKWPDVTFKKLVTLAFKGKVIEDYEHVILRRLRGAS